MSRSRNSPGAARPPARVRAEREQRVFHGRAAPRWPCATVRRPHVHVQAAAQQRLELAQELVLALGDGALALRRLVSRLRRVAAGLRRGGACTAAVVGPPSQSFFRVGAGGDVVQGRARARGLVSSAGSGYASSEASVLTAGAAAAAAQEQDVREDDWKNQEFAVGVARA